MAPGSIFHHINLSSTSYFHCLLFCFYFTLHLYHKNTKNIILSYLSDLTIVSGLIGIDNPYLRWLRGFICLCRCEVLVRGLLLNWYHGSQKLREILTLLCCIILSSSGKTNIVAIFKGGSDKYGVSNPQGAKGKINILWSPICHWYDSTYTKRLLPTRNEK